MKKILIVAAIAINLFWTACAPMKEQSPIITETPPVQTGHPAVEILSQYQDTNKPENVVIPYFVNLMGLDLMKQNPTQYLGMIKTYINWYLEHLNYPDKYGATGSIYDYIIYDDGREESRETMDSIDSYAATFISLINRYYELSGEWAILENNRQKLEDIAYLMPWLQKEDELTIAKPDTPIKYLMDNCEVLAGVTAFASLSRSRGWSISSTYSDIQTRLTQAIRTHFYNPGSDNYDWAIQGEQKHSSGWTAFYPDGLAQLFPILYGIIQDQAGKESLWNRFHDAHSNLLPDLPVEQNIIYQWTKAIMENGAQQTQKRNQTEN